MARRVRDITVTIAALDDRQHGLATFEDRNVHVRNALPGETVLARVLRRRRGDWYADALEVRDPAAERMSPVCPNFPRCGGCAAQHVSHPVQLQHKQAGLLHALAQHGVTPREVRPPLAAGLTGYRRKARLGVRCVGGEVLVGFRESFSNRVARMDECAVLTPEFAAALPLLKSALGELSIADRVPQLELAQGDGAGVVMLRHLAPLTAADLVRLQRLQRESRLTMLLQPGGYDTLVTLEGAAPSDLHYLNLDFGLRIDFQPTDFTQVNAPMNRLLVRSALALLGPVHDLRVADLFCGIGNFSLPLARRGAQVVGYELGASAVTRAQANARRNGLAHRCEFYAVDLYDRESVDRVAACAAPGYDALLFDPPRSGCGVAMDAWLTPRCTRIVYVSCNPLSFASDAKTLQGKGYALQSVGALDMFPFTAHVETLGLFVRVA